MGWPVHSIGDLDLTFNDPENARYMVDEASSNPDPDDSQTDNYVPLNNGAGALLASTVVAQSTITLSIACLGVDYHEADANLQLLYDVVAAAKNSRSSGITVEYQIQKDTSQDEPKIWKVIGGKIKPVNSLNGQQWFGVHPIGASGPRAVAFAVCRFDLSKN